MKFNCFNGYFVMTLQNKEEDSYFRNIVLQNIMNANQLTM